MDYGLVLSGGGTRGAAHVGVLKALEEEKLLPDTIAGTSAGSIVAGLYASGMDVDELWETVLYLSRHGMFLIDPDYLGLLKLAPQLLGGFPVSLSGLLKGKRLTKLLAALTDQIMIQDLPRKLLIPAADLNSGYTIVYTNLPRHDFVEHTTWKDNARLCDVMSASSRVPAVFCPQITEDYCLVDGGVTNNLPVDLLKATGKDTIIAVDIGSNYQMPHRDSIFEIVSHSFSLMSHQLKECTSQKETLLLKPSLPKDAGLFTFSMMKPCMESGYAYTKKKIPLIRQALNHLRT